MWTVLTLDIRKISGSYRQLALLLGLFGGSPQSVEENSGVESLQKFKFDYERFVSIFPNLSVFLSFDHNYCQCR